MPRSYVPAGSAGLRSPGRESRPSTGKEPGTLLVLRGRDGLAGLWGQGAGYPAWGAAQLWLLLFFL